MGSLGYYFYTIRLIWYFRFCDENFDKEFVPLLGIYLERSWFISGRAGLDRPYIRFIVILWLPWFLERVIAVLFTSL